MCVPKRPFIFFRNWKQKRGKNIFWFFHNVSRKWKIAASQICNSFILEQQNEMWLPKFLFSFFAEIAKLKLEKWSKISFHLWQKPKPKCYRLKSRHQALPYRTLQIKLQTPKPLAEHTNSAVLKENMDQKHVK